MQITISDGKETVTLSDRVLNKLAVQVNRANEAGGLNLTTLRWIVLHLRELAISEQLAALTTPIKDQAEADARTAFEQSMLRERERLLADLDK